MSYAITETGWRGIEEGWSLGPGESLVEELPTWLIERVNSAELARNSFDSLRLRLQEANDAISPLQAQVDLEEISDEDRATWKAWKRYLIDLSKTPERTGWPLEPDWPKPPQSS